MDGNLEGRRTAPENAGKPSVSLAHEINNPLECLSNLLFLLELEVATENGYEYIRRAHEEIRRLFQITHSAIDELRTSIAPEVDVSDLLSSVVDLYKSRLDSLGITLHTRFCASGSLAVYSVPLRQAFTNLLLNAADAMPGGGTIAVHVAATQEWTGRRRHGLRITIADNGSGIAESYKSKIFEQFFTTKGDAGSGVGLSIVKETVERCDGVIRVRSCTTPGRSGTVFAIFFPSKGAC